MRNRFDSTTLFYNLSYQVLSSGFELERADRTGLPPETTCLMNPIVQAVFANTSGKRIRLLAPASDSTVTDQRNVGTWPLPDLLSVVEKIEPIIDDTLIVPIAESNNRQHWVLLLIQNRQCYLFDPKSLAWFGYFPYDLTPLKNILKEKNLLLPDAHIHYTGLQGQFNTVDCGYICSQLIKKLIQDGFLIHGNWESVKTIPLENNIELLKAKHPAECEQLTLQLQNKPPINMHNKPPKSFLDFLKMYVQKPIGHKIFENNLLAARSRRGAMDRLFNSFPINWPGYELANETEIAQSYALLEQMLLPHEKMLIDSYSKIQKEIEDAALTRKQSKELTAKLFDYASSIFQDANGNLKKDYLDLITQHITIDLNPELANQIANSYIYQIIIPILSRKLLTRHANDEKFPVKFLAIQKIIHEDMLSLLQEKREKAAEAIAEEVNMIDVQEDEIWSQLRDKEAANLISSFEGMVEPGKRFQSALTELFLKIEKDEHNLQNSNLSLNTKVMMRDLLAASSPNEKLIVIDKYKQKCNPGLLVRYEKLISTVILAAIGFVFGVAIGVGAAMILTAPSLSAGMGGLIGLLTGAAVSLNGLSVFRHRHATYDDAILDIEKTSKLYVARH